MLTHPMADRLRSLGLTAMADALLEMRTTAAADDLSREDWLGLLLDREATSRENKRLSRRLSHARLRQNAVVENTDFRAARGLDRALFHRLAGCDWIQQSPALGDQWSVWGWQVVAGLRPRPQRLSRGVLRAVSAGATAVHRTGHRPRRGAAGAHAGKPRAYPPADYR